MSSEDGAQVTSEVVSEAYGGLMTAGLSSEESGAKEPEEVNDSQLSLESGSRELLFRVSAAGSSS